MPQRHPGESNTDFERRLEMYAESQLHALSQYNYRNTNEVEIPPFISDTRDIYLEPPLGYGYSAFQSYTTPDTVPTSPMASKPKKLTDIEVETLRKATQSLVYARQDNANRIRPQADHRERDYINIIQSADHRNKTARELINSESPIYLGHLDYEVLKEMIPFSRGSLSYGGHWKILCSKTGREIPLDYSFACMGSIYGADAVPTVEMCACCEYLKIDCKTIKDYEGKDVFLCIRCLTANVRCQTCSKRLAEAYLSVGYCSTCIDNPVPDRPLRLFALNKKWCDLKPGAIIQSPRMFSFEVETLVKSSKQISVIGDTIPAESGMSGDSSINGNGKGIEIQSPRLQGAKGEEFTTRVAGVLKNNNAVVNASCGMHVHLDADAIVPTSRSEYPRALVEMWKAYVVFEDVIFSVLPYNRRINRYCRPLRDYFKLSEIEAITSMYDAERLWYKQQDSSAIRSEKQHHHHASRYFGVNFHSLFGGGHLELRHHSGTLNAKKVLQWANLHALIMDAAQKGKFTYAFLAEAQATTNVKDKTKMLFEVIGLAKSSQRYFHERQNKFNDKSQQEDGLVKVEAPTLRRTFIEIDEASAVNFFNAVERNPYFIRSDNEA